MSISIRAAVKNLFSEKYNKQNILYYIGLLLISGICGIYMQLDIKDLNSHALVQYLFANLVYLFIAILAMGIFIIAANNGYKRKDEIFPNLFKKIKDILITGLKAYGGFMIIYIAITFIMLFVILIGLAVFFTFKIMNFDNVINVIFAILAIIITAVLFTAIIIFIIALMLNFMKSLEFEDLLNLKKAKLLISKCRNLLSVYILKSIAVGIIGLIIFIPIFITVILGFSLGSVFNNVEISDMQGGILGAVLGTIYAFCVGLIQLDLEIQFLQESDNYMPKEEPKPSFEEEYLEDYIDED